MKKDLANKVQEDREKIKPENLEKIMKDKEEPEKKDNQNETFEEI